MVGPSLVVPRGELFVFLREVPTGTATFLYKEGILFATLNFAEKYLEEVQCDQDNC